MPVKEWAGLLGVLAVLGVAASWRLGSMIVPDMDEGVYVYAGKLMADGLHPYRDFMLAHPPLVPLVASLSWKLGGGSLDFTRWVAIALTTASCIPLYLLARRVAASPAAALISVCVYLVGLVWTAHLGRTIRLEPVQNALLVSGAAAWLLGSRKRSGALAGVLLGAAMVAKLTSAVPIALLAAAELAWPVGGRADARRRGMLVAGAALVLLPAAAWCVTQEGFVDWVIRAQVGRPRETLAERSRAFGLAVLRFPLLLLGWGYAVVQLASPDSRRRTMALLALGTSLVSVLLFATFFRHYLALALPWIAVLLGTWVSALPAAPRRWLAAAAVAGAIASPVVFTELSFRRAPEHASAAATVLPSLRAGRGYLLTSYPDFALASGRPLLPWYFSVDNYLGRQDGLLGDAEFASAVARAQTVVLSRGEAARMPVTATVLDRRFRKLPVDPHWEAWEALTPPDPADAPGWRAPSSPRSPGTAGP